MKKCPRHPEIETMVVCMSCGRHFCRLCSADKGSTHHCDDCASASMKEFERKAEGRARHGLERPPSRLSRVLTPLSRIAGARLRLDAGWRKKADRWRERAPLGERVEEHSRFRARERAARMPATEARRNALLDWLTGARKRLASLPGRVARAVLRLLARALLFIWRSFPIGLVEKEAPPGDLPYGEKWKKLALAVLGSACLWVVVVALAQARLALAGYAIGVLLGVGFARILGGCFTGEVGVMAGMATVVSILLGEMAVQVLHRLHFLKNIGINERLMVTTNSTLGFYAHFFRWFVVGILLMSGVVAFLVGAWPFPKRFCWKR